MKKHLLFSFLAFVLFLQLGMSQTYIWGGPGDKNSEFNGGLNDWTVKAVSPNANALWVWEADGKADKGAYSGKANARAIASPSVANGAMVFDSDFYDNAGTAGNFGAGVAPGAQIGELISPTFSCAGKTSVWLKFNQYFRNYKATPKVAVSADGGATWKTPITLNGNIALNASTTTDSEILLDLSADAAGYANVKIKFIWEGEYYFWIVDDVYVLESTPADPQILGTWYPSMHYGIPQYMSNRDSMYFIMDIANPTTTGRNGIEANVTLYNYDLQKVFYTDSRTFDIGAKDSTRVYFDSYMLPSDCDTGLYAVEYEILGDDFGTVTGKLHTQYFRIYPEIFNRDEGSCKVYTTRYRNVDDTYSSGYWGGSNERYNINFYKMGDWAENKNVTVKAVSSTFAVSLDGSDLVSYPVKLTLHEISDSIDNLMWRFNFVDGLGLEDKASEQLTLVGYGYHNVENVEDGSKQTLPLYDINTDEDGVKLVPNRKYFIACYWPEGLTLYQAADNSNSSGSSRYYYRWDNDVMDGDTLFGGQYVSYTYSPADGRFYIPTGTGSITLVYGLDLNLEVWRCTNLTQDELLPENALNIIQNPVSDKLSVNVKFDSNVDKATLLIYDLNGSLLNMRNIYNTDNASEEFKTGNYPAGEYIITLFTKDKLISKKFVVVK